MRTAGLPTFSKLYQRNDTRPMQAGTYVVTIDDCKLRMAFLLYKPLLTCP